MTETSDGERSSRWTPQQLESIGASTELVISVRDEHGRFRRPTPIWVVCVGEGVYVRTWYRRSDGWFGHAVQSHRARIQVAGVDAEVAVVDISETHPERRADIDETYRTKYARYGRSTVEQMVSDSAASTTLELQVL
jgi:hypothetical protein